MKFWSKREYSMGALLWGWPAINFVLLIPFFFYHNQGFVLYKTQMISLVVLGVLTAVLYYIWFNTYYLIEEDQLKYKVGFFGGSLDIRSINSVTRSEYMLSGNRPAMGLEGLLIRYGGDRKIFISPADEAGFLQALQEVNNRFIIE